MVSNAKIQATLPTYLSPHAFTDHTPEASSLCSAPAFACRREGQEAIWGLGTPPAPLREHGVVVGKRTKVEGKGWAWGVGKLRVAREVLPLLLFIITPPGKNKLRHFNRTIEQRCVGRVHWRSQKGSSRQLFLSSLPQEATSLCPFSLSMYPSFLFVFPSPTSASSEWIKPRDSWPAKPVHKLMFLMTPEDVLLRGRPYPQEAKCFRVHVHHLCLISSSFTQL